MTTILKPKTSCEIKENIRTMDINEFFSIYDNQDYFKGIKIGFKKRMAYFFKEKVPKYFLWIYIPVWVVWIGCLIFTQVIIPTSDLFPFGTIDIVYFISICIVYTGWIPLVISIRLAKRYLLWKMNQINGFIHEPML